MVNASVTTARDAERALVIGYAPANRRAGLAALLALDDRLGAAVGAARTPLAAQVRLAWWRDALAGLDRGVAPAEPVLAALVRDALPLGICGGDLAAMAEAREQLLPEPLDAAALDAFAAEAGGTLFTQAARLLTSDDHAATIAPIGEGWVLAGLGGRLSDAEATARARDLARVRLTGAFDRRWPRALRPLGALALLARADLADVPPGSPRRIARLLIHRLTGR